MEAVSARLTLSLKGVVYNRMNRSDEAYKQFIHWRYLRQPLLALAGPIMEKVKTPVRFG